MKAMRKTKEPERRDTYLISGLLALMLIVPFAALVWDRHEERLYEHAERRDSLEERIGALERKIHATTTVTVSPCSTIYARNYEKCY
jgi:hypothetical protein